MSNRWWWLPAMAITGCYVDPDRYVREQSDLLCDLESECDAEEDDGHWNFGVDRQNGESCEDARERELDRCTASCEYDDDAARACMRELKQARRTDQCALDDDVLVACARVFYGCEIEADEEPLQCDVEAPQYVSDTSTCSIAPTRAAPTWAIAVLGLAIAARRRRPALVGTS